MGRGERGVVTMAGISGMALTRYSTRYYEQDLRCLSCYSPDFIFALHGRR